LLPGLSLPYAAAEFLEQPVGDLRMLQQEGLEVPLWDARETDVGQGGDGGAATLVVEQGHLAEMVAGAEPTLATVRSGDFDIAIENDHESDAGLALNREHRAFGMTHLAHLLRDAPQIAVLQSFKELHGAQVHCPDCRCIGDRRLARDSILLAMSDPKIQALAEVPLFAQYGIRELEFVASRSDEVDVPAGYELVTQGSLGDTFFLLLDGEAEVSVDGKPRRTLKAGDFFGEISMLDRGPATATVVSRTPARLMVMSHAQFRDAIKASDDLLARVMAAMGARLRADSLARSGAET
jgi:hypothetical protein